MTHSVQLVIGRGPAMETFLSDWSARAVDLREGWRAAPMEEALHARIEAASPGAGRSTELDASPAGLEAVLAAATAKGGALAYVETDYFGGAGGQSAMAFVEGREAMAPQRAISVFAPINQALRTIGVVRNGGSDEFDTIGLGERRTMDDYAIEGPRRLRAGPPAMAATSREGLPTWIVLAVIFAMIGLGIAVSLLH